MMPFRDGRALSLSRPLRFGACEARLENLLRELWDDPVSPVQCFYGDLDALLRAVDRGYAGTSDAYRLQRLDLMVSDLRWTDALAVGPAGVQRRPVLCGSSPILDCVGDMRDVYIEPIAPPLRLPPDPSRIPAGYPAKHTGRPPAHAGRTHRLHFCKPRRGDGIDEREESQ